MKLFISYRRKENVQRAMNLASLLQENFGQNNVFLDTSDIPIGQRFPEKLSQEIGKADTIIALISPEWLSSLDENFRRRIDSPQDWVHRELAMGLEGKKEIVPVYVGGARKLAPEQLPAPLMPLAELQGLDLRDDHHWKDDVIALVSRLKGRETSSEEIIWPKAKMKYVPDAVGPVKIQAMMAQIPDWELREFEVDSGPFKGQHGNEIRNVYNFRTFLDAVDFMTQTSQVLNAMDHHPRWENIWRNVIVRLSSWEIAHRVTERDFMIARYLDRAFRAYQRKSEKIQDKASESERK